MSTPDSIKDDLTNCEKCNRLIKKPERLCSFCLEEAEKTDGMGALKKIVPDSAHGFWWAICRWQLIIAIMLLSGIVSGIGCPKGFAVGFFLMLAIIVVQFAVCIAIPCLIRFLSNRQQGRFISLFIAFFSWLLMAVYIGLLNETGIKVEGFPYFVGLVFSVSSYKIMRSVAGFSSVFWNIKKNRKADDKFSEPSGENVRKENRSQVAANSDSLIREVICSDVSNDDYKKKEFIEQPETDSAGKSHVGGVAKNTMAKINLVLLLALISWVSVLSYYCWDGLNRSEKRDTKIIKKLDDAERKREETVRQIDMKLDARIGRLLSSGFSIYPITNQDEFEKAVDYANTLPSGKERSAYESSVIQYHEISMSRGEDPWIPRKKKRFEKNSDKATYSALDLNDPAIEAEAREAIGEEEVKYLKGMDERQRMDFAVGRAAAIMFGSDDYGNRAMLGEKLGVNTSDMETIFWVLKEIGDKRRAERNKQK